MRPMNLDVCLKIKLEVCDTAIHCGLIFVFFVGCSCGKLMRLLSGFCF